MKALNDSGGDISKMSKKDLDLYDEALTLASSWKQPHLLGVLKPGLIKHLSEMLTVPQTRALHGRGGSRASSFRWCKVLW